MHTMKCLGLRNIAWPFTREFKNSRFIIDHVYFGLPKDYVIVSVLVIALADHQGQLTVVRLPSNR